MTNERSRLLFRVGLGVVACLTVGLAAKVSLGGLRTTQEVVYGGYFQSGNPQIWFWTAEGSLGSARASSGNTQYIGCNVKSSATSNFGLCFAKRQDGLKYSCVTTGAEHIRTIQSINGQSWIKFEVSGTADGGPCGWITVENASNLQTTVP